MNLYSVWNQIENCTKMWEHLNHYEERANGFLWAPQKNGIRTSSDKIFQEEQKKFIPWLKEVYQALKKCGLREADIENTEMFRNKTFACDGSVRAETKEIKIERETVSEMKAVLCHSPHVTEKKNLMCNMSYNVM